MCCWSCNNEYDLVVLGKKLMESLRTFVFVETVLRRGRIFQGSDEV